MAKAIKTPFGEFDAEDKVKVVTTNLLGATKEIEGEVVKDRISMGIQYLVIKEDETEAILEFPMTTGFVSYVAENSLPAREYNRVVPEETI